jgi:hypothetical protein
VQRAGGRTPVENIKNYDAPGGGIEFDVIRWSVTPFG